MSNRGPEVPPPDTRGLTAGGLKYTYKEPTNVRTLEDQHPEHYSPEMVARMKECIKSAKEVACFRIKKHVNDPFRSLFTLEVKVDGAWSPVKDGDLLVQVVERMQQLVTTKIEESTEHAAPDSTNTTANKQLPQEKA